MTIYCKSRRGATAPLLPNGLFPRSSNTQRSATLNMPVEQAAHGRLLGTAWNMTRVMPTTMAMSAMLNEGQCRPPR